MKLNKKLISSFLFFLVGCESDATFRNEYIDPQIIFSSRRWWNYDIFISDVYSGHMTQFKKNKHLQILLIGFLIVGAKTLRCISTIMVLMK